MDYPRLIHVFLISGKQMKHLYLFTKEEERGAFSLIGWLARARDRGGELK